MADSPVKKGVDGATAHDTALPSGVDPVAIGGRASANEPTEVSADGDAVWAWADRKGRLVVAPHHPEPDDPVAVTLTLSSQVNIIAAPGASLSHYVTLLTASNTNTTTAVRVDIKDGSTVRFSFWLAKGGGGFVIPFPTPWKLAANAALTAQLSAAVTDVRVTAHRFVAA